MLSEPHVAVATNPYDVQEPHLRSDAWLGIANVLNVDRKEAEKKIKNLVAQFRKELKKKN